MSNHVSGDVHRVDKGQVEMARQVRRAHVKPPAPRCPGDRKLVRRTEGRD